MDIFASVKARVGVREAAERYGVRVDGRGMARCPFHDDRRPSLYVADGHFHCFACGAHGDCIDFAARLFRLSPLKRCGSWRRTLGLLKKNRRNTTKHSGSGKTSGCAFCVYPSIAGRSGGKKPSLRREGRATTLTRALRRPAGSLNTRSICSTS